MNQFIKNNQTPLLYGFYGAVLGFVFYFMLLLSGNSPWSSASWMGAWIPGVSAFLAVKKTIAIKNKSFISFSTIFQIAVIVISVQAVTYELLVLFSDVIMDTGALEIYLAEIAEQADQIENVFGDDFSTKILDEIKKKSFSNLAFEDFVWKIIGGIIVSLILATRLKKKPSVNE